MLSARVVLGFTVIVELPLPDTNAPVTEMVSIVESSLVFLMVRFFVATVVTVSLKVMTRFADGDTPVALSAGESVEAVGAVVSMTNALLAPREPAAPGDTRVRVALFSAASLMVPALSARDVVAP